MLAFATVIANYVLLDQVQDSLHQPVRTFIVVHYRKENGPKIITI